MYVEILSWRTVVREDGDEKWGDGCEMSIRYRGGLDPI